MSAPAPREVSGSRLGPPGLVAIPGGPTWIGTTVKQVFALGAKSPNDFDLTARETPMHERRVDDFYIGVTEVTNEQFREYVQATGARPPVSWGLDAVNEAAVSHAIAEGLKAKQANDSGQSYQRKRFDQALWWRRNWGEVAWEVPEGHAELPVVNVDHEQASGYARWAGLRLMSEFEFQRAGRGKSKHDYIWGPDWDPTKCANAAVRQNLPTPMGSFAAGATAEGVHDLCGNVWEWTASPFEPYPGFKVLRMEEGRGAARRILEALVHWDASQRVVVGGSFQHGVLAARLTTRRPAEPGVSADGLGFRVAASATPGVDLAQGVLAGLPSAPAGVDYEGTKVAVVERWQSRSGTASVPGYSVITRHDHLLFVPARSVGAATLAELQTASREQGPVHLGLLSTSVSIPEPALPAGTYFVTYRGPGPLAAHEGAYPADIDLDVANLLFHTTDLQVVAVQGPVELDCARARPPALTVTDALATWRVSAFSRVDSVAFAFTLVLKLPPGTFGEEGRR